MKNLAWMVPAFAASLFLGCGQSDAPAPASDSGTSASPVAAAPVDATDAEESPSPSVTVGKFYEALRAGDAEAIAQLLTDKAREETARSGLDIRTQGSTTLSYELGEIDYVTEARDGVHVKSLWTETDPDSGEVMTSEVIWVLRKQPDGWRVAGMATPVVEGQLPLLFNFEDPEDMMWKKNYIESEMAGTNQASPADGDGGDSTSTPEIGQAAVPDDGRLR